MAVNQSDIDTNLFTGVDLRAFWETLRLRWWIIPVVMTVSVGLLWAQASELRTEPEFYRVTRTYEARDQTAVLASVGIDPVSVRAFPDAANQLLVLQSPEVRREIETTIGQSVNVSILRGQPSFTLIDTLESDGKSSFVFQSAGVPTYTFSCTNPELSVCDDAIDAYVGKAGELRAASFAAGLSDLQAVLTTLKPSGQDQTLDVKLGALKLLIDRLDTPFVQIAARTDAGEGATLSSVRRPTFVFSAIAGLIVALLILLQLTMSDRRIRSARRVASEIDPSLFLGDVSIASQPTKDLLAAVSLQQECVRASAKTIVYVPLSKSPEQAPLERLAAMCGVPFSTTKPFPELSVPELVSRDSDHVAILVVQRNHDLRQHLLTAVSALRRSGQRFGGVLLLD